MKSRAIWERPQFYFLLGIAYVSAIWLAADKGYPFIAAVLGLAAFFIGALWDLEHWKEYIRKGYEELEDE